MTGAGLARHHRPPTTCTVATLRGECARCGLRIDVDLRAWRVTGPPPEHAHDGTTRCPHCGDTWADPNGPGWGPDVEPVTWGGAG